MNYVSFFLARLAHDIEHPNDLDGYKLLLRRMESVVSLNNARKHSLSSDALNLITVLDELAHLWLVVALGI